MKEPRIKMDPRTMKHPSTKDDPWTMKNPHKGGFEDQEESVVHGGPSYKEGIGSKEIGGPIVLQATQIIRGQKCIIRHGRFRGPRIIQALWRIQGKNRIRVEEKILRPRMIRGQRIIRGQKASAGQEDQWTMKERESHAIRRTKIVLVP